MTSKIATALFLLGLVLPACGRAAPPELAACLTQLRAEAARQGIRPAEFDRFTKAVEYDEKRALPDTRQPEFTWPIWEYLGVLVDAQRIEDGRRMLQEQAAALAKIEQTYGIDAATVVAVFGVETNFGAHKPKYPVVETFVNRACGFPAARVAFKREQKGHLFQALRMLQEGEVQEAEFLGSRAGAFGLTQFMPLTYAVDRADVDGDGRADIINSVPDALGATAKFMVRNGFTRGLPAIVAVELPAKFDVAARGPKTIAQWRKQGVKLVDAGVAGANKAAFPAFGEDTAATLVLPEGPEGRAFLATANFTAFRRYNASDAYAFAIALLAETLRGLPRTIAWASGETGLSRKEIAELQLLLIKRGHAGVKADGVPGMLTRDAVRAEQKRLGWPETGLLGAKLLEALRAPGS